MQAVPNDRQKTKVDHANFNNDALIDSAVTVYPIHVNYLLRLLVSQWHHQLLFK